MCRLSTVSVRQRSARCSPSSRCPPVPPTLADTSWGWQRARQRRQGVGRGAAGELVRVSVMWCGGIDGVPRARLSVGGMDGLTTTCGLVETVSVTGTEYGVFTAAAPVAATVAVIEIVPVQVPAGIPAGL